MRLIPQSLFARTALVIIVTLILSQVVSVLLFRQYSREPRLQLVINSFISHLHTLRSGLESIPPEQHKNFLMRLREEQGITARPVRDGEQAEPAPDLPMLRPLRERLKAEFGSRTEIYQRPRRDLSLPPQFAIRLPIGEREFWVAFPRNRVVDQDFSWAWAGWGLLGGLLALLGALLVVQRVNRPLKQLAIAARELGKGNRSSPVAEIGPGEVQAVARAFNQMRDDLLRAERDRATFLAGVSHDLRTPLTRLRLGVEMSTPDEAARNDMVRDIDDINGVVEQFMNFARDESQEKIVEADINQLVRDVTNSVQRLGASIQYQLAEPLHAKVRPMALRRAVGNLINNALKHAGPDILVTTAREGSQVIIGILDRGPGIPESEVERLKQPFTRLDTARSGQSGAGLGLAIVDRIAHMHGGTLKLLARPGGGLEARLEIAAGMNG